MSVSPNTTMRSEERRALVLLGITAILASFLATMYALIWTGLKKQGDFFFNFPCSVVPHLTVLDVPLLETLIRAWVAYAFFAFFYFSEDWFWTRRGTRFRLASHVVAAFLMGFYFLYVVWFIPVTYVWIVWVDPYFPRLVSLYLVGILVTLFYIELRFVELVTDTRGTYGRLLRQAWLRLCRPLFIPLALRLRSLARRLWDKNKDKLPRKLRDRIVGSKRIILNVRVQRRLRGRVGLFRVAFWTLLVLALVVSLLYSTYCGMFL